MSHEARELRAAARFLERFAADRALGRSRPLAEYQREDPRFAAVIAREFEIAVAPEDAGSAPVAPVAGGVWGDYTLERLLGRGGQGAVWLARDARLGRRVALKLLTDRFGVDESAVRRFAKEARALAVLDHPGLCAVHESGVANGAPFLAMRYVPGATLAARLGEAEKPPDRPRVLAMLAVIEKLARAAHAAHEAGVIHRDLKPANVMVGEDGTPVILDFGLAGGHAPGGDLLTLSGDILGTPAYMAPEQAEGDASRVDRRADVHALGAILFEAITGRRPYDGPTRSAVLRAVQTSAPPDPRRVNPAVSQDLAVIVAVALAKRPADRYPTALALAEDVRRARCFEPISARPLSWPGRLVRWARRKPAAAMLLSVLMSGVPTGAWLLSAWGIDAPLAAERRAQLRAAEVERLLGVSFALLADENEDAALRGFQMAAGMDPRSREAACGAALALAAGRRHGEAIRVLDECVAAAGDSAVLRRTRHEVSRAIAPEAGTMATPPDPAEPSDDVDAFVAGVIAARSASASEILRGDVLEPAADLFLVALESAPRRRKVYFEQLARRLALSDRPADAKRMARVARIAFPGAEGEALAGTLLARSDPVASLQACRKAIEEDPARADALDALFGTQMQLGSFSAAREIAEETIRLRPSAAAWFNLSMALDGLQEFEAAVEAARTAVSLRPDLGSMRSNLARRMFEAGRPEAEVLDAARVAALASPDEVTTVGTYAELLFHFDHPAEALDPAQRTLALNPESAHTRRLLARIRRRLDLDDEDELQAPVGEASKPARAPQ